MVSDWIRDLFAAYPRMPATVIAERMGWSYSIRTLSERVRELGPLYLPPDPASRTTYLAGEIAQCDFWFPNVDASRMLINRTSMQPWRVHASARYGMRVSSAGIAATALSSSPASSSHPGAIWRRNSRPPQKRKGHVRMRLPAAGFAAVPAFGGRRRASPRRRAGLRYLRYP